MAKSGKQTLLVFISVIVVALVGYLIFQANNDKSNEANEPSQITAANEGNETTETNENKTSFWQEESIIYLGDADAVNEIVYAFDYSCPWCTVWIEDVLPDLQERIDAGEIKFRTQSLALLNHVSLKLAQVDENLKVHYPTVYYDVFLELIRDSTQMEITDDYLQELADTYELDLDLLLGETEINLSELTQVYLENLTIESVPTLFLNGERVETPFEIEAIEALLIGDK